MEKLTKKLLEMKNKVSQPNVSSAPKPPKQPTAPAPAAPSVSSSQSKKDPEKVAQQLENSSMRDDAVKEARKLKEGVSFNKSGQWSIYDLDKVAPVPLSP